MTPRHVLLVAGLGVAGWLAFFGDKTPVGDIAEPVARAPRSAPALPSVAPSGATAHAAIAKASSAPDIAVLLPRDELIGGAHASTAANVLFVSQNWNPPPPPPPPKPAPPPPPTAPPLPFTYLGKKIEDGAWEVYVSRGDQTLILHVKSIIDGTYRVDAIQPPTLSVTYMPLNQVQTLAIGGLE